ncbi:MAG: MoaD/ThiS family protein [Saprospiraceae bacterium]
MPHPFSVTLPAMPSIKISVLFFGQITDYTTVNKIELKDFKDTDTLLHHLKAMFPRLKESPYQMALDKEIIHENTLLTSNHTVALLPPYAGG